LSEYDSGLKGSIKAELNETEDPCHYNILNFPKNGKASGRLLKKAWDDNRDAFYECEDEDSKPIAV
tara:strand:- start:1074 stop:1271 length:198 start_codon:yes stop_codon:yes gene_type:complete